MSLPPTNTMDHDQGPDPSMAAPKFADPADPRLAAGGYYDKAGKWNLLPMDANGRRPAVPPDAIMPPALRTGPEGVASPPSNRFGPQPGMSNPNAGPPRGYGSPVVSPNYRTTRAGGSPTFNPGMPTVPTRFLPPNTPQTAIPFPNAPSTPGARTPKGAQPIPPGYRRAGGGRTMEQRFVNGQDIVPDEQAVPGSFITTDGAPLRVLGGNDTPLEFDDDPMAGDRQIVSSRGLRQDEFASALLPQHREALADAIMEAGQEPGSRYSSVGSELSRIRNAMGNAMSADNLTPDERDRAMEMLRRREDQLLYSAAYDTGPLVSERHRMFVQRQQAERMDAREVQRAMEQHEKAMEKSRQQLWEESVKRAQEELYSPNAPLDPDQVKARAMQHYASQGGAVAGGQQPQQQPQRQQAGSFSITPGDDLDYRMDDGGSFVAEDEDGNVYPAAAVEGRLVVMPESAAQIDALPPGTAYATWSRPDAHGNQRVEVQRKEASGQRAGERRKPTPSQDEVDLEVRKDAEAAVKRRVSALDSYQQKLREWEHQKEQGKDALEPMKPRELEDAEQAHRNSEAFIKGSERYEPTSLNKSDLEAAESRYYKEKGTTKEDMARSRMAEEAATYHRVHNGIGMQVRIPGGGEMHATRHRVGDRSVLLPVAVNAQQAMWLVRAGTPHLGRGADGFPKMVKSGFKDSPLLQAAAENKDKDLLSTDNPGRNKGVLAVRDYVNENFGYLGIGDRKSLMRQILTDLRYTGQ